MQSELTIGLLKDLVLSQYSYYNQEPLGNTNYRGWVPTLHVMLANICHKHKIELSGEEVDRIITETEIYIPKKILK